MDDYKNLLTKTAVGELKKQLKEGGMRGYSKMKKSEIIDLMVTKKKWEREGKVEPPPAEAKVEPVVEELPAHLGGEVEVKPEKPKRKRSPKAKDLKVAVESKQVARDA
jgi:hypothetical protein